MSRKEIFLDLFSLSNRKSHLYVSLGECKISSPFNPLFVHIVILIQICLSNLYIQHLLHVCLSWCNNHLTVVFPEFFQGLRLEGVVFCTDLKPF